MARSGGRSGGRSRSGGRGGGRGGGGSRGGGGGGSGDVDLRDLLLGFWYIYRFLVWLFGEKLAQALLLLLALTGMGFFFVSTWRGGSLTTTITRSTIQREPLPAGEAREAGYLQYGGRLVNEEAAIDGMRYFYEKTGVQPCLWIAERIDGSDNPSWEAIDAALERQYKASFTDQGHLLVLFHEPRPDDYKTAYYVGDAAELILDEEATDILLDYLDKYYYDEDLSEGEYFGAVFTKSADRIMSVTADPKNAAIPAAVVIGAILIFAIVVQARKRGRLKRERAKGPVTADPGWVSFSARQYQKASSLIDSGKTGEARSIIDGILSRDPDNIYALWALSTLEEKEGRKREQRAVMERIIRAGKDKADPAEAEKDKAEPAQAEPVQATTGPGWRGYSLAYIGKTLRKPLALFLVFMAIAVVLAEELAWFADGTVNPAVFPVVLAPLALTALYWGIFLAALKPERKRTNPKGSGAKKPKLDPQENRKSPGAGKIPVKTLVEPASAIFDTLRRRIPNVFPGLFPVPKRNKIRGSNLAKKPGDGWGVLFAEVFVAPLRNVRRTMIIVLCAVFAFMIILLAYHDNFTKRVGGPQAVSMNYPAANTKLDPQIAVNSPEREKSR